MCMQQMLTTPAQPTTGPRGMLGMSLVLQAMCANTAPPTAVTPFASAYPLAGDGVSQMLALSRATNASLESYVTAAILLQRVATTVAVTSSTLVRLFITALCVAAKWQDDIPMKNTAAASIAGVTLSDFMALEAAFLTAIDFACLVTPAEYAVQLSTVLEYERNAYLSMGVTVQEGPEAIVQPGRTLFRVQRDAAAMSASIGLLFNETRVIGVVPRSASQTARLARGMYIHAVNGQVVRTHQDVTAAIAAAGATIDIEVHPTLMATHVSCAPFPQLQQPVAMVGYAY